MPKFLKFCLFVVLYWVTAYLGLKMDAVSGFATLIWPPIGISLFLLLIWGPSFWPAISIGAFGINFWHGASIPMALGIAVGNTLAPLVATILLKHFFQFEPTFKRLRDVLALILLAAGLCTMISATFGVVSLIFLGDLAPHTALPTWLAWWAGDALGILVLTPFLLVWRNPPPLRNFILFLPLCFIVTLVAFGEFFENLTLSSECKFLVFPLLIYATLRHRMAGSTLTILMVCMLSVFFSALGIGPFLGAALSQRLMLLSIFMTVFTTTGLILAATIEEIQTSREKLTTAEEKLLEKTRHLQRSNQALEEFAFVASHDLQSPLRSVEGFLGLLETRSADHLNDSGKRWLDKALQGVSRMQTIIQDLLAHSRFQTEAIKLVSTDTESVIKDAIENLKSESRQKNAAITHDSLPCVLGSRTQLVQLFQNLISNGIKFNRSEEPAVHVSCQKDGGQWCFAVRDNGIGISPRNQEKIFQLFSRLHGQNDFAGNGIGLAVCRKIVEQNNGRIWVESEVGVGTTFFFTLPGQESAERSLASGAP